MRVSPGTRDGTTTIGLATACSRQVDTRGQTEQGHALFGSLLGVDDESNVIVPSSARVVRNFNLRISFGI